MDSPGSESMFPDNVELGSRVPGSMPLPAPHSGHGGSAEDADDDAEEGSRLYVWNPADTTKPYARPHEESPAGNRRRGRNSPGPESLGPG